jgi:tRNA(adenine34) deaminase
MLEKKIDSYFDIALRLAEDAYFAEEVPVGAIVVSPHGEVLSEAYNLKEKNNDVTAHAEIIALKKASENLGTWRLNDCSLIVTLEPCPMCLSAILQSRIKSLYFGAYDKKGGALSLGYEFPFDRRLNHKFNVYGGFKHYECSTLLSKFFRAKRNKYKT